MWKNEASGNSAEFCFDKWPHWPHWQTPTVLVNDQATDVCVSYSSDSSLHCLPIACCCPFPAALLAQVLCEILERNEPGKHPLCVSMGCTTLADFAWIQWPKLAYKLQQQTSSDAPRAGSWPHTASLGDHGVSWEKFIPPSLPSPFQ